MGPIHFVALLCRCCIALTLFLAVSLAAAAFEPKEVIGACAPDGEMSGFLLSERKNEIIARFMRYAGEDENGEAVYKLTFITAHPARNEWYLLHSDHAAAVPEGSQEQQRLCIVLAGTRIQSLDHEQLKAQDEEVVELSVEDGFVEIPRGFLYWESRKMAREEWQKLERLGRTPSSSGRDPYLMEVLGMTFDLREADAACAAARKRWSRERCDTYEKIMEDYTQLLDNQPTFEAVGHDHDGIPLLMTVMVDLEDGRVTVLATNQEGGTVRLQTGRDLVKMGWAADVTER